MPTGKYYNGSKSTQHHQRNKDTNCHMVTQGCAGRRIWHIKDRTFLPSLKTDKRFSSFHFDSFVHQGNCRPNKLQKNKPDL